MKPGSAKALLILAGVLAVEIAVTVLSVCRDLAAAFRTSGATGALQRYGFGTFGDRRAETALS